MSDSESPVSSRLRSRPGTSTPKSLQSVPCNTSLVSEPEGAYGEERSPQSVPVVVEPRSPVTRAGGFEESKQSQYIRLGKECGLRGGELAKYVRESLAQDQEMEIRRGESVAVIAEGGREEGSSRGEESGCGSKEGSGGGR